MPELVAGSDAHHRDSGRDRGQALGIDPFRASVVGDLQHVHPLELPGRPHLSERSRLRIPGEQCAKAPTPHHEDDAGVVRLFARSVVVGPQDLQLRPADGHFVPVENPAPLNAASGSQALGQLSLSLERRWVGGGWCVHGTDARNADQSLQTSHVIVMIVCEYDGR